MSFLMRFLSILLLYQTNKKSAIELGEEDWQELIYFIMSADVQVQNTSVILKYKLDPIASVY